MRLQISETKNASSFYVVKSIYENGKRSTRVVEKLGTRVELEEKLNGQDPIVWAKKYVEKLTAKEKENKREVLVRYSPNKTIPKDKQTLFNGGYLFLQSIYYQLGLSQICKDISKRHKIEFDLDSIFSRLIYSRIMFPASKLATFELSKRFLQPPNFELHQIYRALSLLKEESGFIQSALYKSSLKMSARNTGIIYYDCTNFFFEIEEESGLKQYGASKEHRPTPIVQMGLFMDGDGIPLLFNINKGNTNEQVTLQPSEEQILKDFNLSKFVVCTDAGLSSKSNREFNNLGERAFITTQSIKILKSHLKNWALAPSDWHLPGETKTYNISEIDEHIEQVFYKERWINEGGLEQKIIVTYSVKYRNYQRKIRNEQIERAKKLLDKNPGKLKKSNANDYKRLIKKEHCTADGEVAEKDIYAINEDIIAKEEKYDGFYAVCTNLEDDAATIMKVNQRRWEIEECFRIMKSEFKARPVYLSVDERIEAHFLTCFVALILFRYLEKKLDGKYTYSEIFRGLKDMSFLEIKGEGYHPCYTRNNFTDDLHDAFGFRTDYEIVTNKLMQKIYGSTQKNST